MYACQSCGKKTQIVKTGAHKHGGAWAMRAPKSRKIQKPNLQRVRIVLEGQNKRIWLCTSCLKRLKKDQKLTRPTKYQPAESQVTATV